MSGGGTRRGGGAPSLFGRGGKRPLDSGRVFVRGGQDRREWRDYKAAHAERQAELRKMRAAQPRPDIRRVRPEARDSRPPSAVGGRKSPEPRTRDRDLRDRGNRPAPRDGRGIERRPAAPSGRPARESGGNVVRPQRGTGVSKEAVPGPGKAVRGSTSPRVPPARLPAPPPGRAKVRETQPGADRPVRSVERPEGNRGDVQERPPAVRTPGAGPPPGAAEGIGEAIGAGFGSVSLERWLAKKIISFLWRSGYNETYRDDST